MTDKFSIQLFFIIQLKCFHHLLTKLILEVQARLRVLIKARSWEQELLNDRISSEKCIG